MSRKIIMPAVMLLLFTFILIPSGAFATTYYVDATNGSDTNSGVSTDLPWQTLSKVNNSTFLPGDNIFFKSGQRFRGALLPPSNGTSGNSITFGSYGEGERPIIDGASQLSCSWFAYPENIITNGDLESWTSGAPTSWSVSSSTSFFQSSSVVHGGLSALEMRVNSSNTDIWATKGIASSKLSTSTPYTFSFWYNIPAGKTGKAQVIFAGNNYLNSSGNWQQTSATLTLTGTGSWTNFSINFTSSSTVGTTQIVIERNSAASASLYFDDFSMKMNTPVNTNLWWCPSSINTEIRFNGVAGNQKLSTTSLSNDLDWYSDGSTFWVYSSTGADPSTVWTDPGIEYGRVTGVVENNKSYINFRDLHVTKGVIGFYLARDADVTDVNIDNVLIDYNTQQGVSAGYSYFYSISNSTINNFVVSHNGSLDSDGSNSGLYHGIYLSHAVGCVVSNGTITDQVAGYSIQIQDGADNNVIKNIYSVGNPDTIGFIVLYNNHLTMPRNNLIYNNIYLDSSGHSIYTGGTSDSTEMNYAYNNTFIISPNTSNVRGNHGIWGNGTSIFESKNNILWNTDITTTNSPLIRNTLMTFTSDFNDIAPERANFIITSTPYSTLSSYVNDSGNDVHSTSTDPLFISSSDFHLQNLSSLIDAGVSTTTRTTDFSGNPIYGTPDIGAYEYQPPFMLGTDKIDPTGSIRIYGDRKYRYTTATSSTMSADFSVSPAEGSWTYSASSSRPEWLNISNITWDTSGDYSKSWTASSSNATTTVFTIGDLRPNTKYDVSVDGSVSSSPTSDSSGKISYTYTGGYSTHTFSVNPSPVVESQPVQVSQSVSSSGGSGFSPAARLAYLAKIYADNGLTYNLGNNAPNDTVSIANNEVNVKATFSRTLKPRASGNDVKALQVFLNNNGFVVAKSGPGSLGNETDFFGRATWNALIKFQNHYADEILKPIGLKYGTGILGPMTLNMIIELSGKR